MAKLSQNIMDPLAGVIYEEASRHKEKRHYLGCSILGHPCRRHLWYSFRGFPAKPPDGRVMLIFELGFLIEDTIIRWLKKSGYAVEDTQLEFSALDGFVRGHCDGIIYGGHIGGKKHILEIKSASKSRFEQFQQFGVSAEPKYDAQVQLYMGLSGLSRTLFVVYCKDNSSIYSERVRFDRKKFDFLLEKACSIICSTGPPDPSKSFFLCRYCDYITICNGQEPFMSGEDKTCGNCTYLGFNNLKSWCRHPEHPFQILHWGTACADWIYLFAKILPSENTPPWPSPVEISKLRSYEVLRHD